MSLCRYLSGQDLSAGRGIRMRSLFFLLMVPLLTSCAFHHQSYVSEIVLEGKNYRGTKGDQGRFYIDDEPLIRMRTGCYRSTFLGESMFPLIPVPVTRRADPHESIAHHKFSLTLSHGKDIKMDLSGLKVTLELSGRVHPVRFQRKTKPKYEYGLSYEYGADVRCGDIVDGILKISLPSNKERVYRVRFKEDFKREISYQPYFTT